MLSFHCFCPESGEEKSGNPRVMVTHKNPVENFIKNFFEECCPLQTALCKIRSDISIFYEVFTSNIHTRFEDEEFNIFCIFFGVIGNENFPFFLQLPQRAFSS